MAMGRGEEGEDGGGKGARASAMQNGIAHGLRQKTPHMDHSPVPHHVDTVIVGNGPAGLLLSHILQGNLPYYRGREGREAEGGAGGDGKGDKDETDDDAAAAANDAFPEALDRILRQRIDGRWDAERDAIWQHPLGLAGLARHLPERLIERTPSASAALYDTLVLPRSDMTSIDALDRHTRLCFLPGEKTVDHVLLARGDSGGVWSTMTRGQALSYAAHLSLPGYTFYQYLQEHHLAHDSSPYERPDRKTISAYYKVYAEKTGAKRRTRINFEVEGIERIADLPPGPTRVAALDRGARFLVRGRDLRSHAPEHYTARSVVLALGRYDWAKSLESIEQLEPRSIGRQAHDNQMQAYTSGHRSRSTSRTPSPTRQNGKASHDAISASALSAGSRPAPSVAYALEDLPDRLVHRDLPFMIVGSGFSAADAIIQMLTPKSDDDMHRQKVLHIFRLESSALRGMPRSTYPDYAKIWKKMRAASRAGAASSGQVDAEGYLGLDHVNIEHVQQEGLGFRVKIRANGSGAGRWIIVSGIGVFVGRTGCAGPLFSPALRQAVFGSAKETDVNETIGLKDERPEYNPEDAPLFAQHVDQETFRVKRHGQIEQSSGRANPTSTLPMMPETAVDSEADEERPRSFASAPFATSETSSESLVTEPAPIDHSLFLHSTWYPAFKGHTPRAIILKLDGSDIADPGKGYRDSQEYADWLVECRDFVKWLQADGLVVPEDSGHYGARGPEHDSATDSSDGHSQSDDADDHHDAGHFAFPHLTAAIAKAIDHFDGNAFPKLNWSAPQDGAWIALTKSARVQSAADLYLLLKASNFVTGDLNLGLSLRNESSIPKPNNGLSALANQLDDPLRPGARLELVFKPFLQTSINPALEFRCFVHRHRLVAIGQRDREYHAFLAEAETEHMIKSSIHAFWNDVVSKRWTFTEDYVFDVYLGRQLDRVVLLDINPFDPQRTDSGVWSWGEVRTLAHGPPLTLPEFRTVQFYSGSSNLPGSSGPKFAFNQVPRDVIDLSQGLSVAEFQERWSNEIEAAITPVSSSALVDNSCDANTTAETARAVNGSTEDQDCIPGLYAIGALASSSGFVRYLGGSVLAVAAQIMRE